MISRDTHDAQPFEHRLRQVAIAVRDLERTVADIHAVLGIDVCFTPGDEIDLRGPELIEEFNLANAVFVIGDTFLELVTPTAPDTAIARFLASRGDSGYMVLVQCAELDATRRRAAEQSVREVWHAPLSDLRGVHLDPRDTRGTFLSLDQPDEPAEWPWAGTAWRGAARTDVTTELVGAHIDTTEPENVARLWATIFARPIERDAQGDPVVSLDQGRLTFHGTRDGTRDCLSGVDVSCVEPDEVRDRAGRRGVPIDHVGRPVLAGLPFTLVAAE